MPGELAGLDELAQAATINERAVDPMTHPARVQFVSAIGREYTDRKTECLVEGTVSWRLESVVAKAR
jgi:hypothetical protein